MENESSWSLAKENTYLEPMGSGRIGNEPGRRITNGLLE